MLRILLAEDNLADVVLVREALRVHHLPSELHVVRDGAEALKFFARMGHEDAPCPDVILLDINLPKIEGPEVLSELRKHAKCAEIPVIVVTSSDAQSDRDRMTQLGVAHYFKKPADFAGFMKLGAVIKQLVKQVVT